MAHYGNSGSSPRQRGTAERGRIALTRSDSGLPVNLVVQPENPVWLTPSGPAPVNHESVIEDGRDIKLMNNGVVHLLSSEFPLLQR
jgi:hypothetical protein